MSNRGIEIHDGHIIIPAGAINKIHMGTEALPITQQEIGQVVVSAVINATVLGGAVKAGLFEIIATENLTGVLTPLISKVVVNDGITVTPTGGAHTDTVFGARIITSILGAGIVAGRLEGLRIDIGSALGSETQSAVQGIFISGYNLGTQSAGNYIFIRAQENGTYTVNTCLYFRSGTGGVTYFAVLHGDTNAWNALGAPTTQSGWVRLMAGGMIRWIRLWSVAP